MWPGLVPDCHPWQGAVGDCGDTPAADFAVRLSGSTLAAARCRIRRAAEKKIKTLRAVGSRQAATVAVRLKKASWEVQGSLRRAELDSMKRLVERHLDSPQLSVDFICARSGWSRATVYRLFETEGGLARYIRRRHLLTALRELLSGQHAHRRILDLAVSHQFSSEAAFNRAFRRTFGLPPGKVRDLAARSRSAAS